MTAQFPPAHWQALLESIGAALYVVERHGERLEYAAFNSRCEALLGTLGLRGQDFLGRTAAEVLPPDIAASVEDRYWRCIGSATVQEDEFSLALPPRQRWFKSVKTPIFDPAGEVVQLLVTVQDVTEQKLQQQRLEEQSLLLRIKQETSRDGMLVTAPGDRILSWNRRFLELWQLDPEVIRQGRTAALSLALAQLVEPQAFRQRIEALDHSQEATEDAQLALRDGRTFEWYTRPVIDKTGAYHGRAWVFRDITKRVTAERRLRESEQRYRLLFETNPDLVLTIDLEGRIRSCNQAALAIVGHAPEQLIGRPYLELVHPEDRAQSATRFPQAIAGEVSSRTLRICHRGGEIRYLDVSSAPYIVNDKLLGIACIGKDVTERVVAIEQLADSRQKLQESRDEIRRLLAFMDCVREEEQKRLARELHDELGQLTTALKLDLGWLKQRSSDPLFIADKLSDLEVLVDAMRDSVHRLLAGLRPQLLEQVGLVAACHALLREFTNASGVQHQLFVSHEELELEEAVAMAAYRSIQEGLTNIVRHAGAHLVRVSLVLQEENDLFLVRIVDDGCGFDPNSVRTQHSYGLLGIRERATLLGGKAQISSAPRQGTTLLVELPLLAKAASKNDSSEAQNSPPSSP